MKALLIKGGRIIDPAHNIDAIGSVLIANGKISWVGVGDSTPLEEDYSVLKADGLIVCPGFIDIHCHLRQPGYEDKETLATGTQAAAQGGFTTVCAMPNTKPPPDSRANIEALLVEAHKSAVVRVLPIGSVSVSRAGQSLAPLEELAATGAIGFSDDGSPVLDTDMMLQSLRISRNLGLPVIDHCEDTNLTVGAVMNLGKVSRSLGVKGAPAAAEDLMTARDIALARLTGGWVHIAHISTAESAEIVRSAKKEGICVTAEVTPHHLALTEDIVRTAGANAKVNPPLRTEKDVQALIQALRDGVIDIIATDHAPHTPEEKALGLEKAPSGISGFETAFGSLMALVRGGEINLPFLISRLTSEPAKLLGKRGEDLGNLAAGACADVVIMDTEKEWVVDAVKFASKGKNTPLDGVVLRGKVLMTIYGGNVAYSDDSLKITERNAKS